MLNTDGSNTEKYLSTLPCGEVDDISYLPIVPLLAVSEDSVIDTKGD